MKMLKMSGAKTLQQFLRTEFTRVGSGTAKDICENSSLLPKTKPKTMKIPQIEQLAEGIKKTKIMAPPTDCIIPIGADLLERGLRKEIKAEFYSSTTRSPVVYRGIPFSIEAALAYGGEQSAEGSLNLLRFANRVPLLYQQRAGAIYKATIQTNWRSYGLQQSSNSLPQGPLTVVVHMASIWPPFTSEAKEALANYDEITKEIKLALQECARSLASFIRKKKRIKSESKKRDFIKKYIPHVAEALKEILGFDDKKEKKIEDELFEILEFKRGELEEIKVDDQYYDEEFAKIGKEKIETEDELEDKEKTTKNKNKSKKETQSTLS